MKRAIGTVLVVVGAILALPGAAIGFLGACLLVHAHDGSAVSREAPAAAPPPTRREPPAEKALKAGTVRLVKREHAVPIDKTRSLSARELLDPRVMRN